MTRRRIACASLSLNLGMTRNGFFALAIGPDVMLPSVAQEVPAQLAEGSLQVSSLHGLDCTRIGVHCQASYVLDGRDRSAARTTVGGEFPTLALSIREVGASFHHGPRFRRPPCDPGRWAFPSPVLTLASRRSPSHTARSLSADPHTPLRSMVCFHGRSIVPRPYHVRVLLELPSAQSPFARARCYLARRDLTDHVSRRYPACHRSYGLMRQSSTLLVPRWYPRTPGLCRLLSAPAGRRTFPTLSLRIFPCVLGPLPRRLVWCIYPFLPPRQRPSPRSDRVGAPPMPVQRLQYGALFEAAVIPSCSGPQVCSPPRSLLPLRHTPYGSRDFSIRASHGLLPPHAPDMLAVRIGQLTVWGLSPHQMRSLVGCSPNAGRQPLPKAGATQERRLLAVACTPWLGPGSGRDAVPGGNSSR